MKKIAVIVGKVIMIDFHDSLEEALKTAQTDHPDLEVTAHEIDYILDSTQVHSYMIEDIIDRANDAYDVVLSETEAHEALTMLRKVADCNDGVSWGTIDAVLTDLNLVKP